MRRRKKIDAAGEKLPASTRHGPRPALPRPRSRRQKGDGGATAIEYALILALIAISAVGAFGLMGDSLIALLSNIFPSSGVDNAIRF